MTRDEAVAFMGQLVEYRPDYWPADRPGDRGRIVRVGREYVFVEYDSAIMATRPGDLTLVEP